MPFNQLRAIASFAKAIELGSIRKAAQAQGITPQAASQAIAQLERHLGVRLMHRTTRNWRSRRKAAICWSRHCPRWRHWKARSHRRRRPVMQLPARFASRGPSRPSRGSSRRCWTSSAPCIRRSSPRSNSTMRLATGCTSGLMSAFASAFVTRPRAWSPAGCFLCS